MNAIVTLPTHKEVDEIISKLKAELSGFDVSTNLASIMVRELHKRLSKSIECKVSVNVTKECMDTMKHMVRENYDEIIVTGFDGKLVIRTQSR
ncbi:hypothetical protein [Photorhabdus khanii]|uniref:hypothetical protein n=1 Tax=Photorhabdus khanii TaxID=1004150 RepID=UPI0010469703|nr:hypothetical protein [Photorhabdus khanii]